MQAELARLVLIAALLGCGAVRAQSTEPGPAADDLSACPKTAAELDSLKTEARVIECLGKPNYTTSNPDGRHTASYDFDGGLMVVFLFAKDGSVIRNRAYVRNDGP